MFNDCVKRPLLAGADPTIAPGVKPREDDRFHNRHILAGAAILILFLILSSVTLLAQEPNCVDHVLSNLYALNGRGRAIRRIDQSGMRNTRQQLGFLARRANRLGVPLKQVGIFNSRIAVESCVAGRLAGSVFAVVCLDHPCPTVDNHVFTMMPTKRGATWQHNPDWEYKTYRVFEFRGLRASEYDRILLSVDRQLREPASVAVRPAPPGSRFPLEVLGPADLNKRLGATKSGLAASSPSPSRRMLNVPPPVGYEPRGPTPGRRPSIGPARFSAYGPHAFMGLQMFAQTEWGGQVIGFVGGEIVNPALQPFADGLDDALGREHGSPVSWPEQALINCGVDTKAVGRFLDPPNRWRGKEPTAMNMNETDIGRWINESLHNVRNWWDETFGGPGTLKLTEGR